MGFANKPWPSAPAGAFGDTTSIIVNLVASMAALNDNHQRQPTLSMIEQLPHELLTKVLEHAELSERLNLSMCNRSLLQGVTRECPTLWIKIDLCGVITDFMLSSLLLRVNAQYLTTRLCLIGCKDNIMKWTRAAPKLTSLGDCLSTDECCW